MNTVIPRNGNIISYVVKFKYKKLCYFFSEEYLDECRDMDEFNDAMEKDD